jgi:hypothetical protein
MKKEGKLNNSKLEIETLNRILLILRRTSLDRMRRDKKDWR